MYGPQHIKARLGQTPFVPFRVVTSSGNTYVVRHPELVIVGIRDIHVGRPQSGDETIYTDVDRIALMHITAMEDMPAKAGKAKKNGKT